MALGTSYKFVYIVLIKWFWYICNALSILIVRAPLPLTLLGALVLLQLYTVLDSSYGMHCFLFALVHLQNI